MGNPKYGAAHQKLRKEWKVQVEQGGVSCARCHLPISPTEPWALDHADDGVNYLGPSHRRCNARTSAYWKEKAQDLEKAIEGRGTYQWFN